MHVTWDANGRPPPRHSARRRCRERLRSQSVTRQPGRATKWAESPGADIRRTAQLSPTVACLNRRCASSRSFLSHTTEENLTQLRGTRPCNILARLRAEVVLRLADRSASSGSPCSTAYSKAGDAAVSCARGMNVNPLMQSAGTQHSTDMLHGARTSRFWLLFGPLRDDDAHHLKRRRYPIELVLTGHRSDHPRRSGALALYTVMLAVMVSTWPCLFIYGPLKMEAILTSHLDCCCLRGSFLGSDRS